MLQIGFPSSANTPVRRSSIAGTSIQDPSLAGDGKSSSFSFVHSDAKMQNLSPGAYKHTVHDDEFRYFGTQRVVIKRRSSATG